MKLYKLALLCGALLLALGACGCNRLKARDHLNKGVQAYRNAQFQPAVMHFKEAVRLDPNLLNARLYLATAYAAQYVPSGESPENKQLAQDAITTFQDVLQRDPGNTTALSFLSQIHYGLKDFDKAKEDNMVRIKVEPNNPEPYYWIGMLDWLICFPRAQKVRNEHNIETPNKDGVLPVIPEKFRKELAEENGPLVEEGLKYLQKAIDLKPNYDEAMAYLNLMYRQKAEIDEDNETREADLKQADDWVNKSLAARKAAGAGTSGAAPSGNQ
jgi:tetratricopeptide (TPR) repeat protein